MFLNAWNEKSENKIKKTISFIIALKEYTGKKFNKRNTKLTF